MRAVFNVLEENILKDIIVNKVLPAISYTLIILTQILQYLSKKSMGVQRDIVFRNGKITSTVLAQDLLQVYKWMTIIGIIFCVVILMRNFKYNQYDKYNRSNNKVFAYTISTLFLTLIFFIMIIKYNSVNLLTYPIIMLCMLIALIIQYIRLVNTLL